MSENPENPNPESTQPDDTGNLGEGAFGLPQSSDQVAPLIEAKIFKLDIDPAYKDKALERVKKIVEGNKFDLEKIKLVSFEGEILQFPATTTLKIATKISRKKVPGRMRGPEAVDNEQALTVALIKEYDKMENDPDMIRKITETATSREDKCFAQQNLVLQLPFWKKDYVWFEGCESCRSTGKLRCQRCGGKGVDQCSRCNGSGMCACSQCRGAQMIQGPQQGRKIQCPTCHGRGRMSCVLCNQTGRVNCPTCRTKGSTQCPVCQGHGWSSNIQMIEIEAKAEFTYPKDELPDKIVVLMEELGPKIAEHAQVHLVHLPDDPETLKKLEEKKAEEQKTKERHEAKTFKVDINYEVLLPHGHVEYDIDGQSYYAFMFGYKGEVIHVSPFLEEIIKNGIRKLEDAVDGRGDIADNLRKAAEYRTLRDIILCAARLPLLKAIEKVKERNSLGIRDEVINDLVMKADRAIKKITDKPRLYGLLAGGAAAAGLFAAYFLGPLHALAAEKTGNDALTALCDLGVLGIGIYMTTVFMQTFAAGSIRKAMAGIVPPGKTDKMTPKLGAKGLLAVLIVLALFLGLAETTRQTGAKTPAWYQSMISKILK